jgi:hypothetical protein
VLHGGPFLDQLVETEVMVMETSLDVGHLEDSPRTAAKCTDNITLRHEAGVRWSFADLILALCGPACCCFDARLGYGPDCFSGAPTGIRRSFLRVGYSALSFLIRFAPAHCYRHLLQAHLIIQTFLPSLLTPDSLAIEELLSRTV